MVADILFPMRFAVAAAVAAVLSVPGQAAAQAVVGNVGLRSADVPTAALQPLESALDRAIAVHAPAARGRTATLSALAADPEVSERRANARTAADAGANSMRQLELEAAQEAFDRSLTLFIAAHGDRLEPAEVARIYTTRAKVAQMLRSPGSMKSEFENALPLHPTKELDPNTFPPESVALFEKVQAELKAAPLAPPATAPLADIARRTKLALVVAGEARAVVGGHRVVLAIANAKGASKSVEFVAPASDPTEAFDAAVGRLFAAAGLPPRAAGVATAPTGTGDPAPGTTGAGGSGAETGTGKVAAGPTADTAVAAATPQPVPPQALPRPTPQPKPSRPGAKPWYRQWYVLAGAAVLAVGAVGAAASSGGSDSSTSSPDTEGVTLVIEGP